MTQASRIEPVGESYSVFIPTMTAFGVPHFTLRPSTLLRQIMTAFFADAGAGGGDAAAAMLGVPDP